MLLRTLLPFRSSRGNILVIGRLCGMALTLPEGHIPWKSLVTSAWNWTSLLCGTSEWLWEMEGPYRSAESHCESQSLTPKRFHGQKGVSCMKKLRVRRDTNSQAVLPTTAPTEVGLGWICISVQQCPSMGRLFSLTFSCIYT